MAGFSRIKGSDRGSDSLIISSLALDVGDMVTFDRANEKVIKATSSSSSEDVAGIVVAASTTSDTTVLVQKVVEGDEYTVDTNANSATTHTYQRMVLTDENTVDNTGTDSTSDAAVVMQMGIIGAVGDKKIRVRLVTKQDRA